MRAVSESHDETGQILTALKLEMKKQKKKYRELAAHLGISVPTVKRAMNSAQLPLQRTLAICEFLELTLLELLSLAKHAKIQKFSFSPEQEKFFAAYPHFLAYLYEVKKLTPAEIEKKHHLSRSSTFAYLKKLEKMELLELHPQDLVKTRIPNLIHWDDHGVLGQKLSRSMVLNMAQHAAAKINEPKEMLMQLQGLSLSAEQFEEFKMECGILGKKYSDLSAFNRSVPGRKAMNYISSMMIADFWEDPIFRQVKEIGAVKL